MMKKLIVVTVMSMIVSLGVSANAATSFSNSLTGYSGDNWVDPAILDGSGLESSHLPGADWHWERIYFDATGATFGTNGQLGNWRGRNTLNTTDGDYNTTSFTATVTVNRTAQAGSVFFGMGTADKGWRRAPDMIDTTNASIIFELQDANPNAAWGTNVINPTPGDLGIYTEVGTAAMSGGGTGLMQLKMEFDAVAETAAFSIDYGVNGTYEDVFSAFNVSAVLAEMATGDRASIYFGTDDLNVMTDFSVVLPERGQVHSPVPANGADLVDPGIVTGVSWYSPEQDKDGVSVGDPNIVSVDSYDVWFGTAEPNELTDTPTFTTSQSLPVVLDYEIPYYWRVDTNVTWDSNDFTGTASLSSVVEGPIWTFSTLPDYVAPVLTFDSVITTLDLLPAQLAASVTGNTQAITSVQFTLLENDIEFPSGAVATLTPTTSDNLNPTAELTTNMPGTYKVNLAVSDGTTTVEAVAEVEVYADACEAQKNAPSGWEANYFDTNVDCIVNLVDFADLAFYWLDDTGMTAQETEVRDVTVVTADIFVDDFDVYSPNDPDYVTNAPLDFTTPNPRFGDDNPDRVGGTYIRNTAANDFVTYEIVVPETDPAGGPYTYTVTVNNSHPSSRNPSIAFGTVSPDGDPSNDDVSAYGQFALSTGLGWDNYKNDTGTVDFGSAGTHLVRVTWIDDDFNLDYILFDKD